MSVSAASGTCLTKSESVIELKRVHRTRTWPCRKRSQFLCKIHHPLKLKLQRHINQTCKWLYTEFPKKSNVIFNLIGPEFESHSLAQSYEPHTHWEQPEGEWIRALQINYTSSHIFICILNWLYYVSGDHIWIEDIHNWNIIWCAKIYWKVNHSITRWTQNLTVRCSVIVLSMPGRISGSGPISPLLITVINMTRTKRNSHHRHFRVPPHSHSSEHISPTMNDLPSFLLWSKPQKEFVYDRSHRWHVHRKTLRWWIFS